MKKLWLVSAAVLVAAPVMAETYTIDPAHSSVTFKIKHVVGKVAGHFDKFAGTFDYDPAKPQATKADATIEATSINTGMEKRDNHLRTPDFFDVQRYPTITFKSTGFKQENGKGQLAGTLTMHGVSKPVVLNLDVAGVSKDPMGGQRAGASATTTINRSDFNIGASSGTMASMVGQQVEISIDIEGVKK